MTTTTPKEKKLKLSFWQRLGIGRQKVNIGVLLDSLFSGVATGQFGRLIEINLEASKDSPEEYKTLTDSLNLDFKNWLVQSVGRLMESQDNVYLTLAKNIDGKLRERKIRQFLVEAENVLHDGSSPEYLNWKNIISILVQAIQEVALSIPMRLYGGKDRVSKSVEKVLYEVLEKIEKIRVDYSLENVPDISVEIALLHRQIAQADDYVWLPLKPLITAPLANNEELDLYSREGDSAVKLAYQIVKSDGVILITGYRGVGKSTFVNAALMKHIAEAEKRQTEDIPWKIVPIQLNIAKAASVGGVLRLCIRAIYREFRKMDDAEKERQFAANRNVFRRMLRSISPVFDSISSYPGLGFLSSEEKERIWFANLRASYKVNMSQAEALSKSRSLQNSFGFRPGDFITAPIKIASLGLLPNVDYKESKDWSEKTDRSISLLDYDEDRADEDITRIIAMLSRPRMDGSKLVRIKLVFVFDEMDKMEANEGQSAVIRQLKNLFLSRYSVFLIVTSKEFYYLLLEDRKKEDSILGSYFSSVITVPMFTAKDTTNLLKNVLQDAIEPGKESDLVNNLAKYLTFRANGLPREIIRELRSIQQWTEGALQSYLSDGMMSPNALQLYAQIEDAIENLNEQQSAEGSTTEQDILNKERIWLNEGRKEQIRRGLYILMDDLLNQGLLAFPVKRAEPEKNEKGEIIQEKLDAYGRNFSTISYSDFLKIYRELGRALSDIRISAFPSDTFFEFTRIENSEIVVTVRDIFYTVTGYQSVQSANVAEKETLPDLTPNQVMQQVGELLAQDSLFTTRRALNYLDQLAGETIPDTIQDKLFGIFLRFSDRSYRLDAGKYLSTDSVYRNMEAQYPVNFLETESNEQIIKVFADLLVSGAGKKKNRELAFRALSDLLNRNFQKKNPLPDTAFIYLINVAQKLVDRKTNAAELLNQIIESFDRFQKISPAIIPALIRLAEKGGVNLPAILLEKRFYYGLDAESLNMVFSGLSNEQVVDVWTKAKAEATSLTQMGKGILSNSMNRMVEMMPDTASAIEGWLYSDGWGEIDNQILRDANKANPRLFYELERAFGSDPSSLASRRVQSAIGPVERKPAVREKPAEKAPATARNDSKPKPYSNPIWVNLVLAAPFVIVYFMTPIGTPDTLSTGQIVLGNIFKTLLLASSGVTVGMLLLALVALITDRSVLATFGVAALLFGLVSGGLYWLLSSWQYTFSWSLLWDTILYLLVYAGLAATLIIAVQLITRFGIWFIGRVRGSSGRKESAGTK